LTESARKILNMQSRIATPISLTGLVDEIKTPEYATVAGLLIMDDKADQATSKVPFRLPKFKGIISTSNFFKKVIDFIKSFLP